MFNPLTLGSVTHSPLMSTIYIFSAIEKTDVTDLGSAAKPTPKVTTWTQEDVCTWLKGHGLER